MLIDANKLYKLAGAFSLLYIELKKSNFIGTEIFQIFIVDF